MGALYAMERRYINVSPFFFFSETLVCVQNKNALYYDLSDVD